MKTTYIIGFVLSIIIAFCIVSCDKNEPTDNEGNAPATGIVSANELAGKWTHVKNNVLYSQVDSSKKDEVIDYSGIASPKYRYYNVTVSEEGVIIITEVSTSGSAIGNPIELELSGNDLKTLDGQIAGTVVNYNKSHSWDNLRIEWKKDYSPISFNALVITTYML